MDIKELQEIARETRNWCVPTPTSGRSAKTLKKQQTLEEYCRDIDNHVCHALNEFIKRLCLESQRLKKPEVAQLTSRKTAKKRKR